MLLGPVRSFSRSRFLISSILDRFRVNFGILGRPQYCVFLQDKYCCSSATRKFSPNPSYLHSGEFVLVWDAKNRSSHTQIVHIEIMRAQMYLKSDETEGNLLSEHINIFARNRLLVPKGVILYSTNIIINFYGPGVSLLIYWMHPASVAHHSRQPPRD